MISPSAGEPVSNLSVKRREGEHGDEEVIKTKGIISVRMVWLYSHGATERGKRPSAGKVMWPLHVDTRRLSILKIEVEGINKMPCGARAHGRNRGKERPRAFLRAHAHESRHGWEQLGSPEGLGLADQTRMSERGPDPCGPDAVGSSPARRC